MLIGYPNVTRGPGFLGAQHGYLYLTDTSRGPAGLSRPDGITPSVKPARSVPGGAAATRPKRLPMQRLVDYDAAIEQSLKLSGPEFNDVFQLDESRPICETDTAVSSVSDVCSVAGWSSAACDSSKSPTI